MNGEMTFFDCNVALGRSGLSFPSFSTSKELIDEMDYYGIDEALVYHIRDMEAGVFDALLDLLELVRGEPRLHPSAIVAPTATKEQGAPKEFVEELIRNGIRAVRVFPKWHRFVFRPYVLEEMLGQLERHHVPVFVSYWEPNAHIWTTQLDWEEVREVLETFSSLPVVATFLGMQNNRFIYPFLKKFENFYVETSTFTYRFMEDVSKKFGADRILYGSQLPIYDPGSNLLMLVYADLGFEDKCLIAGANLRRLLNEVK